ncbi:MAG: transcription factor [Planctomycetaceae bacterium]|nr:transcription factor [Planctomycetaceae bacterium]
MKTRIRRLKDGSKEIIRLLSPENLESWSKDDPLSYEKSIVWLSDIAELPFVRARLVQGVRSRRGAIYLEDDARVVGYSKLTPNAPRSADTNGYIRRVFYLKPGDLARRPPDIPSSAVDPRTVLPGIPGEVVKPT